MGADGAVVHRLQGATAVAVDKRTGRLFVAESSGQVSALRAEAVDDDPLWQFTFVGVHALRISEDGTRLAAAGRDGRIRILTAATGQIRRALLGHDWTVSGACFVDNDTLATASWDETIRVWDLDPRKSVRFELEGHSAKVHCMLPIGGTSLVVTGAADGTMRLWDYAAARLLQTLEVGAVVWSIVHDPESGQLTAGLARGEIWRGTLDLRSRRIAETQRWQAATGNVHDICMESPNRIALVTSQNEVGLFDLT